MELNLMTILISIIIFLVGIVFGGGAIAGLKRRVGMDVMPKNDGEEIGKAIGLALGSVIGSRLDELSTRMTEVSKRIGAMELQLASGTQTCRFHAEIQSEMKRQKEDITAETAERKGLADKFEIHTEAT